MPANLSIYRIVLIKPKFFKTRTLKPNYKNTIKKLSGNTADIVSVVMEIYNKDWQQVRELARTFGTVGFQPTETICKNIFDYIINNVRYKEDPAGVQWVKTPARLIADGVGDCKSMSIFTASCLRCLGIDHFFRFVSFDPSRKDATHVYVVALLPLHEGRAGEGLEIIIDPVVRPVQFNKEEPYTYRWDLSAVQQHYNMGAIAEQIIINPAQNVIS